MEERRLRDALRPVVASAAGAGAAVAVEDLGTKGVAGSALGRWLRTLVRKELSDAVDSAATEGPEDRTVQRLLSTQRFRTTKSRVMDLLDTALREALASPGKVERAPEETWTPGDVEGLGRLVRALRATGSSQEARALLDALKVIPMYWMRRPREETEALVAIALDLLLEDRSGLEEMAALDAGATWFRNMLSSQFGRCVFEDLMRRNRTEAVRRFASRLPLRPGSSWGPLDLRDVRCCGYLLESSSGRTVLREALCQGEDSVDELLARIAGRAVSSTVEDDPMADALRDVLVRLVPSSTVLEVLLSAPESERAVEVVARYADTVEGLSLLGSHRERLGGFLGRLDPRSSSAALIACKVFGWSSYLPEGTRLDFAAARALCATPLGALTCAFMGPDGLNLLVDGFLAEIEEDECGQVPWQLGLAVAQLVSTVPALKDQGAKSPLVEGLKRCAEALAQKVASVAETGSVGTGRLPCTQRKLEDFTDLMLEALRGLLPPFPECLAFFEPKSTSSIWTLVNRVLDDEGASEDALKVGLRFTRLLLRDVDLRIHLAARCGLKEAVADDGGIVDEVSVLRTRLALTVSNFGVPLADDSGPTVSAEEGLTVRSTECDSKQFECGSESADSLEVLISGTGVSLAVPEMIFEEDPETVEATRLATEYGVKLGLLKTVECRRPLVLRNRFRNPDSTRVDWLLVALYLTFEGDVQRAWDCTHRMRALGLCEFGERRTVFVCHNVEMILGEELPAVLGAFRVCGMSVSGVCGPWLTGCFLDTLPWDGVCRWLLLQVVHGPDAVIYHMVCVLAHLKDRIVENAARRDLARFLTEVHVEMFRDRDFAVFFGELGEKYGKRLLHDIHS